MKNYTNKILIGFILFFISINAFSILPAAVSLLGYGVTINELVRDYDIASSLPNSRNRIAKEWALARKDDGIVSDRMKSPLISKYSNSSYKNGKVAFGKELGALFGFGALFTVGNIGGIVTEQVYVRSSADNGHFLFNIDHRSIPDRQQAVFVAIPSEIYINRYDSLDTIRVNCSTYIASIGGYSPDPSYPFYSSIEGGVASAISQVYGSTDMPCTDVPSSISYDTDFSQPQRFYVPPEDINDDGSINLPDSFQNIPAVLEPDMEGSTDSELWDLLQSLDILPPDYQGLDFDQALDRANSMSVSKEESIFDFVELPVNPDWKPPEVSQVNGDPTFTRVDQYNDQGEYIGTVIDHYNTVNTITDGVITSTSEVFSYRENFNDPALQSTTSLFPEVYNPESTSSTTESDAVANSQGSSSQVSQTSNSQLSNSILNSILGTMQKVDQNTANINTSVRDQIANDNDLFNGDFQPPPPLDFSSEIAEFEESVPTVLDIQNELDLGLSENEQIFNFDEHQYEVDLVNDVPCFDPSFTLWGKEFSFSFFYFCQVLDFFGVVLLALSYYLAFLIVFSNRRV